MGSRASGITERVGDGVEIGTQGLGRHRSGRGAHTAAATPMPGQAEPCRGGGEMQGLQEAPALPRRDSGPGDRSASAEGPRAAGSDPARAASGQEGLSGQRFPGLRDGVLWDQQAGD